MAKFNIGDLVRSNYKSKKDCIWRVKDIETEKVRTASFKAIKASAPKASYQFGSNSNSVFVGQVGNVQPDGYDVRQTLVLERVFAPGTNKNRTIKVDPICCTLVTKDEIKALLIELQKNLATLSNLLAVTK